MTLGAVKMMRFLYELSKNNLKRLYLRYKIGQKSGNTFRDFLYNTGDFKRYFSVYKNVVLRPKCRTKFLAFSGNLYSICISANGEI